MFQIDNTTAVSTQPAVTSAGTPGFFSDGNPATGQQATIVPAEFMNMIMMELANLVTTAGLTLSKSDYTQVTQAVKELIATLATVAWGNITDVPADLVHSSTAPTFLGLELYSAAPYVDFHFNQDSGDYNMRLVNNADGTLSIVNKAGTTLFTITATAATLAGAMEVKGAATLDSTLEVKGAVTLDTTLGVTGNTTLGGAAEVKGATTLDGTLEVKGAVTLDTTLGVTGSTTLGGAAEVKGAATLDSTLEVKGAVTLDTTLEVKGAAKMDGAATVTGSLSVGANASVTGTITASAALYAGGGTSNMGADGNLYGTLWGGYLSNYLVSYFAQRSNLGADYVAYAGATGGVGTYAFLARLSSGVSNPGDSVAGSLLVYSSPNTSSTTSPAGTWRCMGYSSSINATLYLRIA